jgi:hypothetical protein
MIKILTDSFSYLPVARHYTVFKGKINESPVVVNRHAGENVIPCPWLFPYRRSYQCGE